MANTQYEFSLGRSSSTYKHIRGIAENAHSSNKKLEEFLQKSFRDACRAIQGRAQRNVNLVKKKERNAHIREEGHPFSAEGHSGRLERAFNFRYNNTQSQVYIKNELANSTGWTYDTGVGKPGANNPESMRDTSYYGSAIEEGSDWHKHTILPQRADKLVFWWEKRHRMADPPSVEHPGNRAYHHLENAMKKERVVEYFRNNINLLSEAVRSAIRKAGGF